MEALRHGDSLVIFPEGTRGHAADPASFKSGLFALAEAYPDLKANANFQQLASELSDLENKIAASRRFFNNAVQEYNTGIQQMPAALFAGIFGFTRKDFFDLVVERVDLLAAGQRDRRRATLR